MIDELPEFEFDSCPFTDCDKFSSCDRQGCSDTNFNDDFPLSLEYNEG